MTIIFSLFVGIYFFYGTLIVKHLLRHRDRVVFPRTGPCLFTKPYDNFFRHDLSSLTGSLLLSEFECPRTSLIKKQQQQQQHIFIFIKKELKKNCCPRPSTRNPRPATLDKKIDSPNLFVEGRGSRVPCRGLN